MPPEIIQSIFSYCPNPHLPLASLAIAAKLSTERMFTRCGVSLLSKDIPVATDDDQPTEDPAPPPHTRAEIEALLRCRWLSWPRFQTILRAVLTTFLSHHPSTTSLIPALLFDEPHLQPPLSFTTLSSTISIPSRLLHGPWTPTKSSFLHYLTFLNLTIDWSTTTLGETATAGLAEAIESKSRLAVASLLTEHLCLRPTQAHLRSSILQHGCDPTIVFHLLSAAVRAKARSRRELGPGQGSDVNTLDPSIWAWLKRLEGTGDPRAGWLKGALRAAGDAMKVTAARAEGLHRELVGVCGRERDGVERIEMWWGGGGGEVEEDGGE
ncbi:hypothetical protein BDZ85DRAFT_281433 [Elsinoe ampelina]|uniref:Uncharacterized protein n=1 Tax=Elsinoe ampelina TaxID=302913 RepID=A0A6A6GCQ1_9PEZI|nr:hypothetical protein BDZ85DRAFT_281433 [Elsinoe ampelina]